MLPRNQALLAVMASNKLNQLAKTIAKMFLLPEVHLYEAQRCGSATVLPVPAADAASQYPCWKIQLQQHQLKK
jgi:hypothetical protein